MAQPSVAREPSMEEILASIRRIIESNDPVNGGSLSQDPRQLSDEDGDAGYDGDAFVAANDSGTSFPAFERGMPQAETAAPREPVQEQAPEAPKSVSLADLAARVRSASERMERPVESHAPLRAEAPQPARPQASREAMPLVDEPVRAPAPLMAARLSEMRDQQLRPSFAGEPAGTVPQRTAVEAERPSAPSPMARIASVEVRIDRKEPTFLDASDDAGYAASADDAEMAMPPVDAHPQPEAESRDLTALVSAATVEQVSRSFSELAAAFDGTERRSLDEVAEEMLRPMLKDWLDDNLPTLVERLVREEIERVARGPRR